MEKVKLKAIQNSFANDVTTLKNFDKLIKGKTVIITHIALSQYGLEGAIFLINKKQYKIVGRYANLFRLPL